MTKKRKIGLTLSSAYIVSYKPWQPPPWQQHCRVSSEEIIQELIDSHAARAALRPSNENKCICTGGDKRGNMFVFLLLDFSWNSHSSVHVRLSCTFPVPQQSVWSLKCHFTQICLPVMSSVTAAEHWTEWTPGSRTINTPQKFSAYQPHRPGFPQFQIPAGQQTHIEDVLILCRWSFKAGQKWCLRQRIPKSQPVDIYIYIFFLDKETLFPAKPDKSFRQMRSSIALIKESIVKVWPRGTSSNNSFTDICVSTHKRKMNVFDFHQRF